MERGAEAASVLAPVFLDGSAEAGALWIDARYLLALALSREALPAPKAGPPSVVPLSRLSCRPLQLFEQMVELARPTPEPKKEVAANDQADPNEDWILIDQDAVKGEKVILQAKIAAVASEELLTRLASSGGWKPAWSARARTIVEGRQTGLRLNNVPLLDVLAALADSLGLVCHVKDDQCLFALGEELPAETL